MYQETRCEETKAMTTKANQQPEKRGCAKCGEVEAHKPNCKFDVLLDEPSPVLDSERAAPSDTDLVVDYERDPKTGEVFTVQVPAASEAVTEEFEVVRCPGCGHNDPLDEQGRCTHVSIGLADNMDVDVCGHKCEIPAPATEAAAPPLDDSSAHPLICKRWFQYDENYKRYIPDEVCTCGAIAPRPSEDYTRELERQLMWRRNDLIEIQECDKCDLCEDHHNMPVPDVPAVVVESEDAISRGAARIAIDKLKVVVGPSGVSGYESRDAHNIGIEAALTVVENLPAVSLVARSERIPGPARHEFDPIANGSDECECGFLRSANVHPKIRAPEPLPTRGTCKHCHSPIRRPEGEPWVHLNGIWTCNNVYGKNSAEPEADKTASQPAQQDAPSRITAEMLLEQLKFIPDLIIEPCCENHILEVLKTALVNARADGRADLAVSQGDSIWIVKHRGKPSHGGEGAWEREVFTQEDNARGFARSMRDEHNKIAVVERYAPRLDRGGKDDDA